MTLDKVRRGMWATVSRLPEGATKAQMTRFGLGEGEVIQCSEVLSRGPVVVRKGTLEVAVGRRLAEQIEVTPGDDTRPGGGEGR
ncbi:MAG TPA: ferrous iron transport protein A [Bacillota bacterium]|jgi:Fe2+ transport system protein FeoA